VRDGARQVSGDVDASAGPVVIADVTPGMPIFATEVFGPVALLCPAHPHELVDWANSSPFALGVTIFGSERRARELVPQLNAGIAMINDTIVPAGHARVPIAARGGSGFGATRGPEGLLAMTRLKAVTATRARRPFHLLGTAPSEPLLAAYALAAYGGGLRSRLSGFAAALRFLRRSSRHE
jgi:aldehyde dehydrogenase (NAD+)